MQQYLPYIAIGVAALVLIVVTILLARSVWRRQVRRFIVTLTGHRENTGSALRTAESVLQTLAAQDVDAVLAFAGADSEERRALREIAERMRVEKSELDEMPLPKKLWPLADRLGQAAGLLADEAGRVGDAEGESVLDALLAIDLAGAKEALGEAVVENERVANEYKLTDPAVYGGGLYI